jgi:hypothetical protein
LIFVFLKYYRILVRHEMNVPGNKKNVYELMNEMNTHEGS